MTLGFIGGGMMGETIVAGVLNKGIITPSDIVRRVTVMTLSELFILRLRYIGVGSGMRQTDYKINLFLFL